MEKEMEKEKNIVHIIIYYLKENLKMEINGMVKVMMRKIISYMN